MSDADLTLKLEIAEIPFMVRCKSEEAAKELRGYGTEKQPLFEIEAGASDLDRIREGYAEANGKSYIRRGRIRESQIELTAIHSLMLERLIDYDVLLLHSSALEMDGEAYLFTASRGTGKSTHTSLWRECFGDRVRMINDDKPVLREKQGVIRAYGTPWNGKHHLGANISAPVKAIACLSRSENNSTAPMAPAEAFRLLYEQVPALYSREGRVKSLVLLKRLLDKVPVYSLGCNMEKEAALTAYKAMSRCQE